MVLSRQDLLRNCSFKTSRSGGKGGQHVNKVSSRVELNYDIDRSELFSAEQKVQIKERLSNRLTGQGALQVVCSEDRSQLANKERCLEKLLTLLGHALYVPKARKATRPGKSAVEQRLKNKQQQALKKLGRKKGGLED